MTDQNNALGGGSVAVITGGGGGLGEGLARHAALRLGMTVVLLDVDRAGLDAVSGAIAEAGGSVSSHMVDVRDAAAMKQVALEIQRTVGNVRLLINNAGVEQFSYTWDTPVAGWERLFDINVNGVFNGIRAFLPAMLARRESAHVWNVASAASVTASPFQAAYIASKHAVLALTECLYQEVHLVDASYVKVAAILPGGIASKIFEVAGGVDEGGDADAAQQALQASLRLRQDVLTPAVAAERIFEQGARGQFYIVTHPEVHAYMRDRADHLFGQKPPTLFDKAVFSAPSSVAGA